MDHYGEEELDEEAAEYLYNRDQSTAGASLDWDALVISAPAKGKGGRGASRGGKGSRGGRGGSSPSEGGRKKKNRGKKKKPAVDPLIAIKKKEIEDLLAAYPDLRVVKGEEGNNMPTYEITFDFSFAHLIKGRKKQNNNTAGENEKGKEKQSDKPFNETSLTIQFAQTEAYPTDLPIFSLSSPWDDRYQVNYATLYGMLEEQSLKFIERGVPFLNSLIKMSRDWFEFNITAAIKAKKKMKAERREKRRQNNLPPAENRDRQSLYEFFKNLRLKMAPAMKESEPVENKQEQLLKEAQAIEEDDYDDFDLEANRIRSLPSVVGRLSDLCIQNIAENLFLYESLEEMPGSIKELIFTFLLKYYKLHPKHMALLLDKDLRNLDLSNQASYMTDKHLVYVKNCSRLKVLNLMECTKITDPVLTTISASCHAITHLILESCTSITDEATLALADGCPNLIELNLNFCAKLKGEGIKKFARRCNQLQILRMAGLPLVQQETLLYVVQQVWSLLYLDASHCGDKLLEEIHPLTRLRSVNLQSLFLHSSKHATSSFLNTLFSYGFPRLKRLGISNCTMLSEESIQYAISRAPYLESIDVSGCSLSATFTSKFLVMDATLRLTKLDISGASIKFATASALEIIRKCTELKILIVKDARNISGLAVLKQVITHPNIESVDVSGTNDEIGGIVILPSPLSKKIRTITADNCKWLVDYYAIELLAKGYPSLRNLSLEGTPITDEGLLPILKGCVELMELNIANTKVIGRQGLLEDLGAGGKRLRVLNIRDLSINYQSKKNFLYEIPLALPNLRKFALDPANTAYSVSDDLLVEMGKNCISLQHLTIANNRNISEIGMGAIFSIPTLRVLVLHGQHLRNKAQVPTVWGMRRDMHVIFKDTTESTYKHTPQPDSSSDDDLDFMGLFD